MPMTVLSKRKLVALPLKPALLQQSTAGTTRTYMRGRTVTLGFAGSSVRRSLVRHTPGAVRNTYSCPQFNSAGRNLHQTGAWPAYGLGEPPS